MGRRKRLLERPAARRPKGSGDGTDGGSPGGDAAINLFIDRGLHELYDGVVNEPVPEEWLRIIEEDRNK